MSVFLDPFEANADPSSAQALSRYNNELGYAKGLALTAGLILSHVPAEARLTPRTSTKTPTDTPFCHQETFWILVSLINRFGFRSYFGCAALFETLLLEVRIFGIILDSVNPKLSKHLVRLFLSDSLPRR